MQPSLVPGLSHEAALLVTPDLTVPAVSPHLTGFADMPPVFATAFMVAFIEATCVEAMRPHLDPGEHSVGIHVDVGHTAATPVGRTVRARVRLTAAEGRILTFAVEAEDDVGPIGKGTHKRAVIDVARFMAKLSQPAGQR